MGILDGVSVFSYSGALTFGGTMTMQQPGQSVAAGWYPDATGRTQWWDGVRWSGQYAPTPPAYISQPPQHAPQRQANGMNVSYVRPQTGHSLTLWILLSLFLVIPAVGLIYYSVSPNHYWHA